MARSRMVGGRDRAEMEARRLLLSAWLQLAILHQMTPDKFTDLKKHDAELSRATKAQLRDWISSKSSPAFLIKSSLIEVVRGWIPYWEDLYNRTTERSIPKVPRPILEQYADDLPDYLEKNTNAPLGAMLHIDLCGIDPRPGPNTVYEVPHISLYEDMALHFNRAMNLSKTVVVCGSDLEKVQLPIKQQVASARAAVTFGIHCVEAYLNSIAADHLLRCGRKQRAIKTKHHELLTERRQNGKVKFVSLRDKVLQYPKIIIGAENPPFQESDCQAMKVLMEANDNYRHSIVHGNPGIDYEALKELEGGTVDWSRYENLHHLFQPKMYHFYQVTLDEAGRVADAVVELIQLIDRSISGKNDGTSWLFLRNEEGVFPRDAFA